MNKRVIDIIIGHKNSITTKYNEEKLSKDFCSYIDNECLYIEDNEEIILNFVTKNNIDISVRSEIEELIRKHYKERINLLYNIIKNNNKKEFILFSVGLFFIFFTFVVSKLDLIIIPEVFQIIGWVLIWESIYADVFVKSEEKSNLKMYKKILNAEVKFTINEA